MMWLEIVGVIAIAIFMPMGFAVAIMLFFQWWAGKKHLRKALMSFYIAKLQRENRKRRG